MRIILIHNFYQKTGGEDIVFNQEAELLRKKGHEVECVVFSNEIINSPLKTFIYFFRSIYNPRSAKVLKERIQNFKPDIIHVHNTFLVASPSVYIMAKKCAVPVVQTLHNYRLICPSGSLYFKGAIYTKSIDKTFPFIAVMKGVYRDSIPYTFLVAFISFFHKLIGTYKKAISKFIVLSEHSKDLFLKSSLSLDESKFIVKPNFLIDPGFKKTKKEEQYIYVGRLGKEKGIETLLNAFKNTSRKLVILGDGELKPKIQAITVEHKNIIYKGFQNRADIFENIRKSKALIFPSELFETFGLTIIEAFACSTPVIISDLGGHAQLVSEGINGFHFKTGDPANLNLVLNKFEERNDLEVMGENARKEYEAKFTEEENYQQLIRIYNDILGF